MIYKIHTTLSNVSAPKCRVTKSLIDSSSSGLGETIPMAPNPALILPGHVSKPNVTASSGLPGKAYNLSSQKTNRGSVGSARTSSSIAPKSFANLNIVGDG